jgi:hypothetical protein
MIRLLGALCLLLVFAQDVSGQDEAGSGAREWATPGEQRGWFAPTTPHEMAEYLTGLAESFDTVVLDTLAWVDGGSVEPDSALPVLLVEVRRPPLVDRERVRVLVLAGQRGDEFSGLEVSLQVVRELVLGEIGDMLDELEITLVPAANPWGLLWWISDEPSGVDPTRDHVLLRSTATKAVHELVSRWRPHLIVELRETGPLVYRVQTGLAKHPNVDPQLASFGRFFLLPYVANELARASVIWREHVDVGPESENRRMPLSGADGLPEGGYLTPGPLGADRAANAFSLAGSLSMMLAVASLDGVEGLADRVQVLYQSLGYLLEVAAGQGDALREQAEAAQWVGSGEVGGSEGDTPPALSLRHFYERDERHPDLVWLVWSDRAKIVQQTTDRWRSVVRRQLVLPVPVAWVIEPEGRLWAELVASHGFTVERLGREERVQVGSYPIGAIARLPQGPADGLPLDSAPDASNLLVRGERTFPEGTWVVRADQPGIRLLFSLIEPWSQDAPLGREAAPVESLVGSVTYPVHRIEDEASIGSLRTEPAELGLARARGDD